MINQGDMVDGKSCNKSKTTITRIKNKNSNKNTKNNNNNINKTYFLGSDAIKMNPPTKGGLANATVFAFPVI